MVTRKTPLPAPPCCRGPRGAHSLCSAGGSRSTGTAGGTAGETAGSPAPAGSPPQQKGQVGGGQSEASSGSGDDQEQLKALHGMKVLALSIHRLGCLSQDLHSRYMTSSKFPSVWVSVPSLVQGSNEITMTFLQRLSVIAVGPCGRWAQT